MLGVITFYLALKQLDRNLCEFILCVKRRCSITRFKKTANSFKMKVSGSKSAGCYITPSISSNYVLNPYSDSPGHGTKITMYEKTTDGTQNWMFEKYGNEYIIHIAKNKRYVLTASGTGVVLKLRTCAANQIWSLEDINAVILSSISVSTPPSTVVYESSWKQLFFRNFKWRNKWRYCR